MVGICYDDIVALNAEVGNCGPITDISINGTFYNFCICFMQYYEMDSRGVFENIITENVFVSKSDRSLVKFPRVFSYRVFGIIDFDGYADAKNIKISNIYRNETHAPNAPMFKISETVTIDNLTLENITMQNHVNTDRMPIVTNADRIKNLSINNFF